MRLFLSLCLLLLSLTNAQYNNQLVHNVKADHSLETTPSLTITAALGTISDDESLKSKLEEDQKALKRMILILSLVGGLGVIAITATIIIFTRMRSKSRRQKREQEQQEEEEEEEEEASIRPSERSWNSSSSSSPRREEGERGERGGGSEGDEQDDTPFVEPSAPPAPTIQESDVITRRRHILSIASQTAATPSAPTAKELDAVIDDNQREATSSHVHSNACNYCLIPELPPPAYTPSAPPHYALPDEPVTSPPPTTSNSTTTPSSSTSSPTMTTTNTIPVRRHSLGG